MIYSYSLTSTPSAALVRLVAAWIEEADELESVHFRPGLLYVIESLSGSLIEIGTEQGSAAVRADGCRIGDFGDAARERWRAKPIPERKVRRLKR